MNAGGILIGGEWVKGAERFSVRNKFSGAVIAEVDLADREDTRNAVQTAKAAFARESLSPYRRYEILMAARNILEGRRDEVVEAMVGETGFTHKDCVNDFTRCLQTLAISAEEAKRITGEMVPIQGAPGQADDRLAFTIRMPVGIVCAITPFNSPLNTVAHKVAPAIAAGNAVVLKPSLYTPLCATILCEVLMEAGVPPGLLNLVNGDGGTVGKWLLEDQDIDYYTFTGSTRVGRIIQQAAGLRRTQLELGNISATIVCADARLEPAAERCVNAAFRKAGQVCTSVQRLLVHKDVIESFASMLSERASKLVVGDPTDPATFVGPMIDEKEAVRAEGWVRDAIAGGAKSMLDVRREGPLLWPVVLRNVKSEMKVVCEEIFAPVISLVPFDTDEEAYDMANATPFGLAGGIFTSDVSRALTAIRRLRMGTVHVNDTSSSRVDLMPYGGVKASGFGHEGPRYAIRDMTEERLITLNSL